MKETEKILKNLSLEIKDSLEELSSIVDVKEFSYRANKIEAKIKEYFTKIPTIEPGLRKEFGQSLNHLMQETQESILRMRKVLDQQKLKEIDNKSPIDVTAPWLKGTKDENVIPVEVGYKHPLSSEIAKMVEIFSGMGFDIYWGRQLDNDKNAFDLLNIPKGHPAREAWDTFYTEEGLVPTPHTSNMQIRVLKDQFSRNKNAKAVVVGKTFRNEELDARHSHTFYQMEGVVVHKNASLGELLGVLKSFLEAYYKKVIEFRVVPAHFPFVEPGLEFAIKCVFCDGKGCRTCGHKGWLEILGAGMIHPVVLRNAGIDPEKYSGYAWGFGIDRLVMNKEGINDIRSLYNPDLNLLKGRRL